MINDTPMFLFALFDTGGLLFLSVYIVITLSDLECDYLNAHQCCGKLNRWVLPELIAHSILVVLMLISWHYIILIFNAPIIGWLIYKYYTIPKGNLGIYDATEIHNRGQLKIHMRDSLIRLAFHLASFFVYLYCMIISLLKKS